MILIIIMIVVVINTVLGVVQESKAEAAIEALQEMSAATSKVLRDGKIVSVRSEDLVIGDVIILEAGDAVPADGRILESASLKIEEAALTGESLPETKISDFPTLVANGEVTATSPENARLGNPRLHDVNYENYDGYSNLVWSELHLLPAGEYIVVFGEYGDTRNTSEETETYWLLSYENVFRLIVPEH